MDSKMHSISFENITSEVRPLSTEWLISFKDPRVLFEENWFALTLEVVSIFSLFQVFRHAKKSGPQSSFLVLAAMVSTISFEILPLVRPGYVLWWYHQGMVNILQQRVPSYVICMYTLIYYLSHSLTERCNLPTWTRSALTSLSALLISCPALWLAQNLMLLVFHPDDPIFNDKLFSVPYIQLVILSLLFFHTSHLFQQNFDDIAPQERNVFNYIKCSLQTGLVSAIYAIVEQYLLYMLLTLTFRLNTGFCLPLIGLIIAGFVKKELQCLQMKSVTFEGVFSPLKRKEWWAVVATFALMCSLPLWLNVQNLKSTGDRLELGPCDVTHLIANTSPLEIRRSLYMCPNNSYFDFHCISQKELSFAMQQKTSHYTICGKAFQNPSQISKTLAVYSTLCLTLFYVTMLSSFEFVFKEDRGRKECKKVL